MLSDSPPKEIWSGLMWESPPPISLLTKSGNSALEQRVTKF